jgi:hypothetical protein
LFPKLKWTDFGTDKFDLITKVPPAADKARPTWGILRIGFKALAFGPKHTQAGFFAQSAGSKIPTEYPFDLHLVGVDTYEVTPRPEVTVGDLAEGLVRTDPAYADKLYGYGGIEPLQGTPARRVAFGSASSSHDASRTTSIRSPETIAANCRPDRN